VTTNSVLAFTRELRETGKTVVFSAHNLYHVESVCDRVAVMNEGRIVARGSVDGIRERHGETTYHVFTDVSPARIDALAEVRDDLGDLDTATEEVGDRFRTTVPTMDAVEAVREAAAAAGGEVVDIRTREPSLADVFLDIVGRPMPGRYTGAVGAPSRQETRRERPSRRRGRVIDRLRRILRVALGETARAGGGVDRRTLLAALALLLVAGGVLGGGLAAGVVGLDVDRDVYRVAVDGDSPYADAVEESAGADARPRRRRARLGDTADLVVFDGERAERSRPSPFAPATRGKARPRPPSSGRRSRRTTSG